MIRATTTHPKQQHQASRGVGSEKRQRRLSEQRSGYTVLGAGRHVWLMRGMKSHSRYVGALARIFRGRLATDMPVYRYVVRAGVMRRLPDGAVPVRQCDIGAKVSYNLLALRKQKKSG